MAFFLLKYMLRFLVVLVTVHRTVLVTVTQNVLDHTVTVTVTNNKKYICVDGVEKLVDKTRIFQIYFNITIDKLEFSSYDASKINKSVELLKGVEDMKVKVKVYDGVKYNADSKKVAEVEYQVKGYEVVTGDRATEIGLSTDENSRDEYNEYLVLDMGNGETATFCNSHVDMFRI